MISIYNSVESPIKDIEILGNTVDGVSVGILQDDGQYKITLFTNNGLDNMSPDYREDKEELLLPCQLEKQGDSTDRLYYDKEEKAWCIYKVGQSKIVLPVTFTIFLNSFYGTTNLYMVSGEVEGTIKAKVSKSLGASVSSLNDKTDILIDRVSNVVEYVGNEIEKSIENKSDIGHIHQIQDVEGLEDAIEENKTNISNLQNNKSNIDHTHNYQQYKLTEDNGNCKFLTGVDLNNVRFTGFYKYEGDKVSNAPIPIVWGYLEVINSDNHLGNNTEWVMQRVTLLESVGYNNATYIRGCQNGLWSKWSKVMFDGSFNMLAQQVSELEIQLLESEV